MKLRKTLLPLLALLCLSTALAWVWRAELALAVAERVATRHMASDGLDTLPDGLHVGLCGAGSPFPDDRRSGPCTLVIAGQRLLVFDAGNGAARNIGKMGFMAGRIDGVYLSHFHSDHIDGLGELMLQRWVQGGHKTPLPVFGPTGVEQVVGGLQQAYSLDKGYRVEHHGDAVVPASGFGAQPRAFALGSHPRVQVFKDADLEITAFGVEHDPVHPAVGYRIDYKGRHVVLSGDTRQSAAVLREASGVDLLVHEALSPRVLGALQKVAQQTGQTRLAQLFSDVHDYHATPEQAAETAREARVGYLLLHHIVPTLPPLPGMEKAFLGQAPALFSGPLRVGVDGDFVSLPAGSKDIVHSRRF